MSTARARTADRRPRVKPAARRAPARRRPSTIEKAVDQVVANIASQSKEVSGKDQIARVATISAGDDEIGDVIADAIVAPPEHQPFFTEQIVCLPDSYFATSYETTPQIPTRREAGLPPEGFVFCCFNNSWKITQPTAGIDSTPVTIRPL